MIGKHFGRWTVIARGPASRNQGFCFCVCECGTQRTVQGYALRKGKSKSCGCWQRELFRDSRRSRPYEVSYNKLVSDAKVRGLIVEFTYEYYVSLTENFFCHYCGSPLFWIKHRIGQGPSKHNIDRKDNSLGYTKDNIVVCCGLCNMTKGNRFSYEEFLKIGKIIKEIVNNRVDDMGGK